MSENNRSSINRRSFLASTAAAAVGSMTFAGSASASGSRVYTVRGSKNDPVTADQIAEANQAAADDFADRNGEVVDFADAIPDESEGSVVDFVTVVDSDGSPRRYGGIVGEQTDPQRVHKRAETRAREFAQDAGTETVSTQSSWDLYHHDEWDYEDCPYGVTTNNFDLYKLSDDGDPDQDAWTIDHWHQGDPGVRTCDSEWTSNRLYPKHRWDRNKVGSMDLDEYDPTTNLSGAQEVNVGLSTGGASIGWTFKIPNVEMTDEGIQSDNYAEWNVDLNDTDLHDEPISVEPGSSVWTNENPDGKIMELEAHTQFDKHTWCCQKTEWVGTGWNILV